MQFKCPFCGNEHDCDLVLSRDEIFCDCGHPLDLAPLRKWLVENARRRMKIVSRMADRICQLILRSDFPKIDIEIEKIRLKNQIMEFFPGRMKLYELIYESRFKRLWEQFRSDSAEGLPQW